MAFLTRRNLTYYPNFLTLCAPFTDNIQTPHYAQSVPLCVCVCVCMWGVCVCVWGGWFLEQPAFTSLNSINRLAFAMHTQIRNEFFLHDNYTSGSKCVRNGVLATAYRYGLGGSGFEVRWERDITHQSIDVPRPTQHS